jgi:ribonuclease HII
MALDLKSLTVKEIREWVTAADTTVSSRTLSQLRRDERQGVQALYTVLKNRVAEARNERLRITKMLRRERALWRQGVQYVAGVDEVGVGPLAGPVVAAAVVFAPGTKFAGVDDSKRLDPDTRAALAPAIREAAVGIGIGMATVAEIDRLNVYHAGLLAMRRAVEALPESPRHVLVDARTIPGLSIPQRACIKGDETCFSIAAASIIAKTHRDRLMADWDSRYPEYGFGRHKGYCTPAHQAAIRRHGPCALHRLSYPFLRELRGHCAPQFYAIKERLVRARRVEAVEAADRAVERAGAALSESERRKLKALIARRRRVLA